MKWLLLRGLIREQAHWGDFPEILLKQRPADSIVCLDIPGTGAKYKEKSKTSITEIVETLRPEWLASVHKDEKVGLIAISLGGMIATEWLHKYPEDFGCAVMINTSLRGYSSFFKRLRWQNFCKILKILFTQNPEIRELKILSLVSNKKSEDLKTQNLWTSIQKNHPVSKYNALRQLYSAAMYSPPEARPASIPISLYNSAADRLVDPSCSQDIALRWATEIYIHPSAGHDLPLDDPHWLIEKITEWLKPLKL